MVFNYSNREKELVEEFSDFWRDQVLLPGDTLAASGVAYHVIDLLLPELTRVIAEAGKGSSPSKKTLTALLDPFCAAAASTKDAVMIRRLYQGLWEAMAEEIKEPQAANPLKHLDAQALADKLFELGKYNLNKERRKHSLNGLIGDNYLHVKSEREKKKSATASVVTFFFLFLNFIEHCG